MGNSSPRPPATAPHSVDGSVQAQGSLHQIANLTSSGRSFASLSSHQSTYSLSRPWSRTSRRRWKESTLTLPYELSKTAWPVSQVESLFLPDFPISPRVSERSFDVLDEISCGSFGKVYKVRELESQKVFALKVLSKSKIVKEDAIQQVKNEVQIQGACGHHTFVVDCPYHWQSRKRLYIVSDYIGGGELYGLLKAYFVLPIVLVQLYIAEIALAIDFLHNAGIVHRDLKPENILVDEAGHIGLIDFGLAKWLSYGSKARRVCGTLRYMAPEIAVLQPYGHAVDWWSLGVIACVMLTGQEKGIWYKNMPLGINTISKWTQLSAEKIGLDTNKFKVTNHSHRSSAISTLAKKGVGEQELIKLTGHSSANSLKPYLQLDPEHHLQLVKNLRGDKENEASTSSSTCSSISSYVRFVLELPVDT